MTHTDGETGADGLVLTQEGGYAQARYGLHRIAPYDRARPVHLWVVGVLFAMDPVKDEGFLDEENLLSVSTVHCYHCVEPWQPKHPERVTPECPGPRPLLSGEDR